MCEYMFVYFFPCEFDFLVTKYLSLDSLIFISKVTESTSTTSPHTQTHTPTRTHACSHQVTRKEAKTKIKKPIETAVNISSGLDTDPIHQLQRRQETILKQATADC